MFLNSTKDERKITYFVMNTCEHCTSTRDSYCANAWITTASGLELSRNTSPTVMICRLKNDWKNVEITGYFGVNSYMSSTASREAHFELLSGGAARSNSAPVKVLVIIQICIKQKGANSKKNRSYCWICI
jgi:hypothetical protein